jgi:SAM-dependent methyltransferase
MKCALGCTDELVFLSDVDRDAYQVKLFRCQSCGWVRGETGGDSDARHDAGYGGADDEAGAADYLDYSSEPWFAWDRLYLKALRQRYPELSGQNVSFLDVGCGWGRLLKAATEYGWSSKGLETSSKALEFIGKNFPNLDVEQSYLDTMGKEPSSFDLISMVEVIEHIDQPKLLLEQVHDHLCDEGLLLVQTGNIESFTAQKAGMEWPYIKAEHVSYFSMSSLAHVLQDSGFEVLEMKKGFFPSFIFRLKFVTQHGFKGPFFGKATKGLLKLFFQSFFSSTMTCVARKTSRL